MLSPGQWYKRVPKEPRENLRFRRWLLKKAAGNKAVQQALAEACRRDILFWINVFVFTFNPRKRISRTLPFISWAYQDEAILALLEAIEFGRDALIEKSRDMGASWICLVVMTWLFLFHFDTTFLMLSRKEDLVDKADDPDSLFWKVDFLLRFMPGWLVPKLDRKSFHFGNAARNSTIDGDSSTKAAGVGGRRTAIFLDEFSRMDNAAAILAGTADTTDCRIFNFTPWGTANAAYRLAKRGDIRKIRMHWSRHPEKSRGLYRSESGRPVPLDDASEAERQKIWEECWAPDKPPRPFAYILDGKLRSPWYDYECVRRANDREVAQMLDIDYQGSVYQFFDRSMIFDLQRTYCYEPLWEGDVSYHPDTGRPLELVKVPGGPLKLWVQPDVNGKLPPAPYGIGADISAGTGATNSVITIANGATGEQVGEYASPFIDAKKLAYIYVALCWLFKDRDGEGAYAGWEHAGPGINFGKKVIELGYRNVYYRTPELHLGNKKLEQPGWYPNPDSKRVLLEDYRTALQTRQYVARSEAALEECLFFIHTAKGTVEHSEEAESDDPTGARVNHGDRVIPAAICWRLIKGKRRTAHQEQAEEIPVGSLAWRRQFIENQRRQQEAWA